MQFSPVANLGKVPAHLINARASIVLIFHLQINLIIKTNNHLIDLLNKRINYRNQCQGKVLEKDEEEWNFKYVSIIYVMTKI